MKLAIVLCAVLGLSFGAVLPHGNQHPLVRHHDARNLNDLFQELMTLIPKDKIVEIALTHLENDPEVQEAVAYLRSDDFEKIVTTVQNMQEFKDFLKYLSDSGLDIYTYINFINDLLGLPHVNPTRHRRSIMSMIDEILAVIPVEEIKKFYHEKVENDPDFIHLLERIRSPEFRKIVDAVRSMPEYTDLLERLRSHGIDVDAIKKKIDDFFGWGTKGFRSTRDLNDLYNEFMKLIPKDKIIEIVLTHLENDPEVQEAFAYMKSAEFAKIVTTVQNMQEFKDFLKYVYDSGFDIYTYINNINDIFGLPHVNPRRHRRSIMSMIDEILAVLPIDEIKKFYHEKLENDPDFIALMERLSSPEFLKIVQAVKSMPEYTDMLDRLKSHGVDVDAIQKKVDDFFGWGTKGFRSTRDLNDLYNEFMKLIPKDKIIEIVLTHLENDPEVQEAFAYMKSAEFAKIVTTVQNMQEFKDFLKYVYDSGFDIYTYINNINDIFGLPHVNPPRHRRSIMSMLDDILAVLPLDEIKKFYHEKLENDPDFIALMERLSSPEFLKIVQAVKSMPEYTDMLDRLKSHGVDVDAIQKKVDDFFGWGTKGFRSTRDLNDLYNEFMKLIPKDKIIEIVLTHLENDPEVQEAFAYMKSAEFAKIVTTVQNMQEFKDFLKYVYDSGFDIYTYINNINDLFGLPHVNPTRHRRSIMSMLDEILAVLPLDEIKKFYHEKLENDPDFIALMERLSSPEFLKIVQAVKSMPEYTDMLDRLKSHGVDVDAIQKKVDDFFGWGTKGFRSTRDLNDLYNEFMKLIPKDKIIEIVLTHLENDPEVQEAFAYMKSAEFAKIVTTVQNMQEFKDFLKYVYDSGFDIYTYINNINDLFGLPHVNPTRHRRSIMSMLDEILAVLPLDEIKKFYHEKLENDPDFIALMERLSSPEFIKIVQAVKSMPEYTDMLDRLKSHGVDVDAIQKKVDDFFGWGY